MNPRTLTKRDGPDRVARPVTVAYIATGANFPDALGAAPVAALGLGPILPVQQNSIPQPTLDELNRLQPGFIYIMGGTGVISAAVET